MYTLRIYFSVSTCVYVSKEQNMIKIPYSVRNAIVKVHQRHRITENFHMTNVMTKQFHSDVILI